MANDSGCAKWGCGCLTVILVFYVGIPLIVGAYKMVADEVGEAKTKYEERAAKRRADKELKELQRKEEAEREKAAAEEARLAAAAKAIEEANVKAAAQREDRLRSFALKEAPQLWHAMQELGARIETQAQRIEELRRTLAEFDKDPETDADFKSICSMREEMIGVRVSLRKKVEDAYLAYRKFEATPSGKEYDELRRKTIEDGIREAEAATRRFNIMRREK